MMNKLSKQTAMGKCKRRIAVAKRGKQESTLETAEQY